jgi:hypothetical protein
MKVHISYAPTDFCVDLVPISSAWCSTPILLDDHTARVRGAALMMLALTTRRELGAGARQQRCSSSHSALRNCADGKKLAIRISCR